MEHQWLVRHSQNVFIVSYSQALRTTPNFIPTQPLYLQPASNTVVPLLNLGTPSSVLKHTPGLVKTVTGHGEWSFTRVWGELEEVGHG